MLVRVTGTNPDSPTNPDYWDCECLWNFIHKKGDRAVCPKCKATEDEQPDSLDVEIKQERNLYVPR